MDHETVAIWIMNCNMTETKRFLDGRVSIRCYQTQGDEFEIIREATFWGGIGDIGGIMQFLWAYGYKGRFLDA